MLPANLQNILLAEEEERLENIRAENVERRLMRESSDPFSIEDTRFKELFRLNKDMAQYVLNEILPQIDQTNNPVAIPAHIKYFGTLAFYATGSYQRGLGRSFDISISQPSMSRAIQEVSSAIINTMAEQWVRFPRTDGDKNSIKERFMEATHFPGVIGAVDCTHVEILQPLIEEHNYINRKGYHSKNIQIICDYDLKILNINARFPGATHDAFIWRNSYVREELETCYTRGDRTSWLLGDSAYPQEPWLMTPILNPVARSPESRYTVAHIQARNCIERCIGVLKGRFLCLSKILRYSPQKVGNITNACAILHNLCVAGRLDDNFNIPPPISPPQLPLHEHLIEEVVPHGDDNDIRQNIIQMYFSNAM